MKRFLWILAASALMIAPILTTGCGADDTESDISANNYNTIGPGNASQAWLLNIK
jgi:hypothetical protein